MDTRQYRHYLGAPAKRSHRRRSRCWALAKRSGDQIVAADLRPTQFSGADRWVGLIARYRDDTNYHYVTLA